MESMINVLNMESITMSQVASPPSSAITTLSGGTTFVIFGTTKLSVGSNYRFLEHGDILGPN